MLSGVGIVCFATSYAVALVMEISRSLFRSGIRGVVMLGFAGIGLVMHTAYLAHRFLEAAGSRLSSERDWYLVAAWFLVLIYLYLVYYHPRIAFGVFLLPLVLGLLATAAWFADDEPRASGSMVWGTLHGMSLLLGLAAVSIGFVAGLMYFRQARRLKQKRPPGRGLRLPSLEWLQRVNSRAIVVSVLALGAGNLSGMVLNHLRPEAERLAWSDPTVLSAQLLFVWLLVTVIAGVFYKPARHGRKVAYLTMVSFVFLVITLGVGLLVETAHGGEMQGSDAAGQGTAVSPPENSLDNVNSWRPIAENLHRVRTSSGGSA